MQLAKLENIYFSEQGMLQVAEEYDRIYCPVCRGPRTKTDHIEIVEPTPVLAISVPRISWNRRMTQRTKNRAKINLGRDLRLRCSDSTFIQYRLHAAVEHIGECFSFNLSG